MSVSQSRDGDEGLKCPACKDIITDPILLPCLHSLCMTCLSAIYAQNVSRGTFTCPLCDDIIDHPENGIDEFQPNYFLNGLLSVYKAKTSKDTKCKICELQKKDTFALLKCLNCGDFLCEDCGKAHTLTRMTLDHEVQPLTDLQDGKRDKEMREKQIIACKIHHGEPVKYYCESCSLPICRECQLEDHVGHTCATAKDSQVSRRKAIANMTSNVNQKIDALQKVSENVDSTLNDIDKREKDLIEGVERTVKKLKDQIEKERVDILKGLKQMDDQRDACSARKEQINTLSAIFSGNVRFCNDIVKNGKDAEVLYQEKVIRQRLMALHAKNINNFTMKWHAPDIRFRNVFLTVDRIGLFELTLSRGYSRKPEVPLIFSARHVDGFQLVRRINTTVPREDNSECRTTGLAFLYGDHFVVGDQENRKVKIFTRMGHYRETIANIKPAGLAVCCDVIGVTDQMSLNLYTNDKAIKKKIPLESTGSSYPVASQSGQYLIVVNNKTVSFMVYDLHGEMVHDIVPARGSKIRNPVFVTRVVGSE